TVELQSHQHRAIAKQSTVSPSRLNIFFRSRTKMSNKQANHQSNMSNANKGTSGTNKTYSQNQGNRGWQMNPQNPANSGKGKK
ncbi:TPA: hypothetical protein ACKJ09_002162, partial [Neisseria gonorrhoeae]